MLTEREIADRLDRLEQPYRAMSQAVAEGVLRALKESGLTVQAPSNIASAPHPVLAEAVEKAAIEAASAALPEIPGVCAVIGALPAGAVVSELALAKMLKRHPASIKRAVSRRELPPPTRLLGCAAWTAGAIVRHIEKRLEDEAKDAEQLRRRLGRLAP